MAIKELKTSINGVDIYARQWDALTALSNSSYLMNTCEQYAIPFINGTADFDDVLRLLANVEHTILLPVLKKFIFVARIKGEKGDGVELSDANINQYYSGKLIDLVLIFKAVCELQYKDFFMQGHAMLPVKTGQ
jgi:hypothetical protein